MAEQQYIIPSGPEIDPQLIVDIDKILAETYAEYGEVDPRLAEVRRIDMDITSLRETAILRPEMVDV